jgi:hypothetical protein
MTATGPAPRSRSRLVGWGWFCAWAVIGAAGALGLISFIVVFVLAVIPLAAFGVWMALRPGSRGSAFGLLTGAGLLFLFVAYVQRDGPGTTCWHTASGGGCEEHLNPIPWLVIGAVLVVAGIVGQAVSFRLDPDAQRSE